MDVGLNTALLDSFRRDEVPRDVRLLAARGGFAPRPLDQLGLLVLLAADPDDEVRDTAEQTMTRVSPAVIASLIGRSDAPTELREFFVARGITPAATPAADSDRPLIDEDDTDYGSDATNETDKESLISRLATMTVPEKVKAAMKGTREMRSVLVRDPNRLVALSVLSSPKLTETEIEAIARMGSVSEDVLRTISRTRAWMKNYNVVLALAKNAKTPVAISLPLLNRLNDTDLRRLSTDRNIPEPLRVAARKRVVIG
jgi:hypothetical protein